jgi:hypothetical protein
MWSRFYCSRRASFRIFIFEAIRGDTEQCARQHDGMKARTSCRVFNNFGNVGPMDGLPILSSRKAWAFWGVVTCSQKQGHFILWVAGCLSTIGEVVGLAPIPDRMGPGMPGPFCGQAQGMIDHIPQPDDSQWQSQAQPPDRSQRVGEQLGLRLSHGPPASYYITLIIRPIG